MDKQNVAYIYIDMDPQFPFCGSVEYYSAFNIMKLSLVIHG
jgi:hypothetical protein